VRGRFIRPAQNPLIRPSQAISRTMDSVQEHSRRYRRFTAKCHSMGGLTGIMLACHDERARDVTVIGVSHELDRFFSERDMEKGRGNY
jgi:hypothetical protein